MARLKGRASDTTNLYSMLLEKLERLRSHVLERYGEVDPIYRRAYGLDRLDHDGPILVAGYQILELIPARQRFLIEPFRVYILAPNGSLIPEHREGISVPT